MLATLPSPPGGTLRLDTSETSPTSATAERGFGVVQSTTGDYTPFPSETGVTTPPTGIPQPRQHTERPPLEIQP